MKPKVIKAIVAIAGILVGLAGEWLIEKDKKKEKEVNEQ